MSKLNNMLRLGLSIFLVLAMLPLGAYTYLPAPRVEPAGLDQTQQTQWAELVDLELRYQSLHSRAYDWQGADPAETFDTTFAAFEKLASVQLTLDSLREAIEIAEAAERDAKIVFHGEDEVSGLLGEYQSAQAAEELARNELQGLLDRLPSLEQAVQQNIELFDSLPPGEERDKAAADLIMVAFELFQVEGQVASYNGGVDSEGSIEYLAKHTEDAFAVQSVAEQSYKAAVETREVAELSLVSANETIAQNSLVINSNIDQVSDLVVTAEIKIKNERVDSIIDPTPEAIPSNYYVGDYLIAEPAAAIVDLGTPLAASPVEEIPDLDVPMMQFNTDRWALANIPLAAISLALVIALAIGLVRIRNKHDWRDLDRRQIPVSDGAFLRILGIIFGAAVLAVVAITQDFSSFMVLIDAWTLLLVIFIFIQGMTLFFAHQASTTAQLVRERRLILRS